MKNGNAKAKTVGPLTAAGAIPRADLPRLDLLRSFDAAARTLSFTHTAQELALTQSAVSRQIQLMEEGLGVPLFERHHRRLSLTDAGQVMQRAVGDCLARLRDATALVRAGTGARQVALTCTPGFASLWLIPRLTRFTAHHPQVDVRVSATLETLDLVRSRIDVAVRFCPLRDAPGVPLFEESLQPVCAPQLLKQRGMPLRRPADLARHTLLTLDTPQNMVPVADWEPWIVAMGLSELRMKNTLRFTNYADAVAAAVAGQGVVIGRFPLLDEWLRDGRLVAPLHSAAASSRAYFIVSSAQARHNPDAQDFVRWLQAEARLATAPAPA